MIKKNKTKKNKESIVDKEYIRICPNCGSKNISYYTDYYTRQYRCKDCNYFANEFPETKILDYKKESKKIKQEVKKNKFFVKKPLWVKIMALILIFGALFAFVFAIIYNIYASIIISIIILLTLLISSIIYMVRLK